ncbi:MAG: hypothetical protein PVI40_04185 [Chlamydiota bacterium]
MTIRKSNHILFITNLLVMVFLISMSFGSKSVYKTLQTENLKISSPKGNGEIELSFINNSPVMLMKNTKGETTFEIQGGAFPSFTLLEKDKPLAIISASDKGGVDVVLNDNNLVPKLHLTSSQVPGIFLKNDESKTVGSWTVINDGGAGLGLADASGLASTLLRGGFNPSVAFFSGKNEPLAALGVMQSTPHLLVSGKIGNEGILIHGGEPNSMLVVDEIGKVKILISKHGVFQGKQEQDQKLQKKDKKIFSLEDHERLFPDIKIR